MSNHIHLLARGEKVFESRDPQFQWDGNYNRGILKGEDASSAVFIYLLDVKTTEGKTIHRKGNVSLIK
jgi:hypothetical protein